MGKRGKQRKWDVSDWDRGFIRQHGKRTQKKKKRKERGGGVGGGDTSAVSQCVHAGSVVPRGSQVIIDQMSACPPLLHVWPLPSSPYWCDSSGMTSSENILFCFVSTRLMFWLLHFVLSTVICCCIFNERMEKVMLHHDNIKIVITRHV